ncbi:hypothetical protein BCR35DRAFT_353984 [Leucosporidium creatinivorum]|uniref:CCZ1/INTU/HSP4 first Longin domain-containing protein n=1 Tax=Leucosporidium creatinivorum TaxID=106004 RepID=A0A1Y2ESG0_9BASI|nr:hypothetical protein BCR35DRAFT_353984 [Leucosporidium creatinivorum]
MSGPRRQRSFMRPFPTLSLLAIYSTTPVPSSTPPTGKQDDAAVEASKVLFFHSAEEDITAERRARLMGTVMGMADFARMLNPGGGPAVRSVHSSKQRMVWIQPEKGFFVHATIDLPYTPRHSRGGSSATIASNGSDGAGGGAQLEDEALLAALEQAYRAFRLLHGSIEGMARTGRESMVKELTEYWEKWSREWVVASAETGSFEQILGALPRSPLATAVTSAQIAPLISQFSASNSSTLPILLHGTSILALPSIPPSPLSPASTTPGTPDPASTTASRPPRTPPPPMSETDLIALVQHLQKTMTRPSSISVTPQPPPNAAASPGEEKKAARSADPSKWSTYTLGMSDYLSQPSMPSLPTISSMPNMPNMPSIPSVPMPSLPSLAMPSMPSLPGLSSTPPTSSSPPTTSAGWGFKKPKWSGALGLGGHKRKSSKGDNASIASVESSRSATPAPSSEVPASLPAQASVVHLEDDPSAADNAAPSTPPAAESSEIVLPAPPTPAVELAPDVDTSALAEAMGSFAVEGEETATEPLGEVEDGREGYSASEGASVAVEEVGEVETEAEVEVVEEDEEQDGGVAAVELFCGEGDARDTPMEVRRFERGPLTLALATLPLADVDAIQWLESRSNRLLEAVETILELVLPPPPPYRHRHLRLEGLLSSSVSWSAKEESWSGKSSQEENEVNAALFDSVRGYASDPPILESLVRLSSSQWLISRRSEELPRTIASAATTLTDIFVVLPAKVGKEGSLVDAGEELRKFDRAYA